MGRLAALVILGALTTIASSITLGRPQARPSSKEDLARDKPATASSFQTDDKSPMAAFDGDPETRWCAADASAPQWLQVDLGQAETISGYRVVWEHDEVVHPFKVEGSLDGAVWTMLDDRSSSRDRFQEHAARFPNEAKSIRQVRLTATATEPDHWASVLSFEVFGTKDTPAEKKSQRSKKAADVTILKGIKPPQGFEVTVFAAPPDVRYPTCLAASPTGEVFVGIDENGSLDAKAGRGRVVRCIDEDDDGKADKFNVFAEMDSPRGLIWDAGTLYVLHPPFLTAYIDTDGDGDSDRSEILVKGIGFDLKFRGADHTTNGIRLGIDGYIYVAVGDYGFVKAEGKDGKPLAMLGGGIARVRTDGTGLEIVSRGQRNIYDVAIDPFMDLFTRDNTNDGDGWDVRLSHVVPTAHYGYPSLFKRFPEEHIQPLADYGGGSPCGSLFIHESILPKPYNDMLYTCEWGRGGIFMHPLKPKGAGFTAGQEMFLEIPRPTDMDVDGQGRIFVSSWKDGGFNYSRPDVGYVIRVVAKDAKPAKFPDLKAATREQLVGYIGSDSAVLRLAAQRALLRKGIKGRVFPDLERLALDTLGHSLAARVAAIFTLEQAIGVDAIKPLKALVLGYPDLREWAIKALADLPQAEAKSTANVIDSFATDTNPGVRAQVAIALGRLGAENSASTLLKLTADPDPIVAHVAVKALVAINAWSACLKALSDPKLAPGASMALQAMHDPNVVAGLIPIAEKSSTVSSARKAALKALCRLYFEEAPYVEGKWWGTRPDTSGPYYKAVTWSESPAIAEALKLAVKNADDSTRRWLLGEMLRNKVDFEETTALALQLSGDDPALKSTATDLLVSRPNLSPDAIRFLEGVATLDDPTSRAKALRGLLRHTNQKESRESALRLLAAISEQDDPPAEPLGVWLDYAKDARHARDAAGFVKQAEGTDPGKAILAYAVLIQVVANKKAPESAREEAEKAIDLAWSKPDLSPRLLRAVALSKANPYIAKVRTALADPQTEVKQAAEFAAKRLNISLKAEPKPSTKGLKPIAATPYDQVLAAVLADKGDAALGATLFEKQGCINCHSIAKGQPIKGPYLGDVASRYNRTELTESILKPSAKIAQGFETKKFALNSGQTYEGFVVREAGDEIEMRNSSGAVTILSKKDIEETQKSELSVMPQGLLDPLTPHDLASLLAYLESLKGK
jgi:putative heme-binding domain-containing protein